MRITKWKKGNLERPNYMTFWKRQNYEDNKKRQTRVRGRRMNRLEHGGFLGQWNYSVWYLQWWICVVTHLLKHIERTTLRVNSSVNYVLCCLTSFTIFYFEIHPCCCLYEYVVRYSLLLSYIQLYGYTPICLSTHVLVNFWVVFASFQLLQIKLMLTSVKTHAFKYLNENDWVTGQSMLNV